MVATLVLVFFALLLVNVPVSFALGLASVAALFVAELPMVLVAQRLVTATDSFILLAVPLFLLAGNLMAKAGLARDLVEFGNALLGRFRGGLAHANIAASTMMGGITGSAVADASSVGAALIPPMMRQGYSGAYAAAVTAASSTISIIIPPSVPMIIYAVVTGVSVTDLFIAGLIPGLMMALVMMLVAWGLAVRDGMEAGPGLGLAGMATAFRRSAVALVMPLVIVGSIRYGIATPTEAAVIAVIYALLAGIFWYRTIRLRDLPALIIESGVTTGVVMLMIATASLYGLILTRGQVNTAAVEAIVALTRDPHLVLLLILVVYLIAGCFLDLGANIIILVPVLFPVTQALGIDPVAFGVITVVALAIGLVTPPVGACLFIACGIARVPLSSASSAALPYIAALILVVVALIFFPGLATWLPSLMKG
jgi:C4-dicarboxylate transporter DctM subunit